MKNLFALAAALFLLAAPAVAQASLPPDSPTITDANDMPANGAGTMVFDANEAPAAYGDAKTDHGIDGTNGGEMKIQQPTIHRVTSLQKCLDQLSPDEAAEVKLNAIYPYQECHSRLATNAEKKRHIRVTKERHAEEEEEEEAESPRNFKRVAADDNDGSGDDPKTAGAMNAAGSENSGHWSAAVAKTPKARRIAREMPPQSPEELENPDDAQYVPPQEIHRKKKRSFFSWSPEFSSSKSRATYNN